MHFLLLSKASHLTVSKYYLRKYGTTVPIDLVLSSKSKKGIGNSNTPVSGDILSAELEVHDLEDFEV